MIQCWLSSEGVSKLWSAWDPITVRSRVPVIPLPLSGKSIIINNVPRLNVSIYYKQEAEMQPRKQYFNLQQQESQPEYDNLC